MKYKIAQFIPIVLVFLILRYSKKVAEFSHTVLGKLLAIVLILFYTFLDKYVGIFVCSLIILYYHNYNYDENALNLENMEQIHIINNDIDEKNEILNNSIYLPKDKTTKLNYMELEEDENNNKLVNYDLEEQFRKQNCDGNVLKYKDMKVSTEMAHHVFPELNQPNCNPCNKSCHFSIIESKIETEDKMKPISTN
jgi:hypothetical protein